MQQINPVEPPAPSPTGTGLKIEQQGGANLPSTAPFPVKTLRITGNTLFDTATLHALVVDGEGQSLTLSKLNELAARITDYYHKHGYLLARAIIPAQTIRDGVVNIKIIEAHYGKISLDNHSRVNDPLLENTLSSLQSGQVIDQSKLDHALLLLSDVPGTATSASLKPGETVGTSDLLVTTAATPAVTGNATLDDYGDSYTGRMRAGGTVNLIDPLHHGDVLSLSGLTTGRDMDYGRIAYEWLLDNGIGTRLGGSYSDLHYELGGSFSPLSANGIAQVESLWTKQPLVRSQSVNLYGQIEFDHMELHDNIETTAIHTDRDLNNWTASLTGDARDTLLSGAVSTWNLGWTSGRVGFDNEEAQLADAATARTQGEFSKLNATVARLQSLSPKDALYLVFSGQWANTNLDSSEKMIAGGPYTVRAYDMGAISGDTGVLGTVEFRHDLGFYLRGQWQAVAFLDSEHVTINKDPWTTGTNEATLSGAGVGLNWAGPSQWNVKAYIAKPIGPTPVLLAGTTSSNQVWVQISKGF